MTFVVFEITNIPSFDYFFSLVSWSQIVCIPIYITLNLLTKKFLHDKNNFFIFYFIFLSFFKL